MPETRSFDVPLLVNFLYHADSEAGGHTFDAEDCQSLSPVTIELF